jgi:uncharacterized protein YciW
MTTLITELCEDSTQEISDVFDEQERAARQRDNLARAREAKAVARIRRIQMRQEAGERLKEILAHAAIAACDPAADPALPADQA